MIYKENNKTRRLLEYDFEFIQKIQPVVDKNGDIKEFQPQNKYKNDKNLKLNKHGEGSFCKFSINPVWAGVSGVYAFFINNELVYIGQCIDFAKRFNQGYGYISARCCFTGGQSTNCKINKLVLNSAKENKEIELYFLITNNYDKIEEELIKHYNPTYNDALRSDKDKGNRSDYKLEANKQRIKSNAEINNKSKITKQIGILEVKAYIEDLFKKAKEKGEEEITLISGQLHKELNLENRLPTVCDAMRYYYNYINDEIIESPPKGRGSRLIIKYNLKEK